MSASVDNHWLTEAVDTTTTAMNATYELICENMSCAGRCGEESEVYRRTPCSCDFRCGFFQDCCVDYTSLCSEYISQNLRSNQFQRLDQCAETSCLGCVSHERFAFKPVYMVSHCPANYNNLIIANRCTESTSDNVFRHIPVFINATDHLYKNIYCAICHSLDMSTLKVFPTEIFCPKNETDSKAYLEGLSLMEITFSEVKDFRCKFRIMEPESEEYPERLCVPTDLDSCKSPESLKEACEGFLQPIWVALNEGTDEERIFTARNQYCAKCSKYRDYSTHCWKKSITSPDIPVPGFRFSLLFDFTSVIEEPRQRQDDVVYEIDEVKDTDNFRSYTVDVYLHFPPYKEAEIEELMTSSGLETNDVSMEVCRFSSSIDNGQREETENMTLYHVTANYANLLIPVSKLVENLRAFLLLPFLQRQIVFASLRNINASLTEMCISDLRHYHHDLHFLELLKSKGEDVYSNNITDQTRTIPFPLEMVWGNNASNVMPTCQDLAAVPTNAMVSRFSVCGDSAEPDCTLVTYDMGDLLNVTGNRNLSTLNVTVLYEMGNVVATCKEHMQKITVRFHGYETGGTSETELYVTIIGCSLSILGLIITVVTYCIFAELRNLAGKCVLNLVAAMLLAQTFFVLSATVAWRNDMTCQGVAIVQHFMWLSTFSWTNIMAYDLARTFSNTAAVTHMRSGNKRYYVYFTIAWSVPFAVVFSSTLVNYFTDLSVGYGLNSVCWIRGRYPMLVSFIAPVSAHILFNLISFFYTIYHIRKVGQLASQMNVTSEKRGRLAVYARITAIMGFTWMLGYLGNIWPFEAIWVIFAAFNSLQGFFLFVSFVLTSKVIGLYRKKLHQDIPSRSREQRASTSKSTSNLLVTTSTAL